MTAKEYLSQAADLRREILARREQLAALRSIAAISGHADGVGGTPDPHRSERNLARISDLSRELDAAIGKLLTQSEEISGVIAQVEDPKFRQLLRLRYLSFLKWERIAEIMGCDVRTVHRLHGRALQMIQVP